MPRLTRISPAPTLHLGRVIAALSTALSLWALPASGQVGRGAIRGSVVDAEGTPQPGTSVTVSSPTVKQERISDAKGLFEVMGLLPGSYQVEAAKAGFRTVNQPVNVLAAEVIPVIIRLEQIAAPAGASRTRGPIPEVITIRAKAGVATEETKQFDVDADRATTQVFINNTVVNTSTQDNTASAQQNLTFDEHRTGLEFGGEIGGPVVKDKLWFAAGAAVRAGSEEVGITNASGMRTAVSGRGTGVDVHYEAGWMVLADKAIYVKVLGGLSQSNVDEATRNPAQTVTNGTVPHDTSEITRKAWRFGGLFGKAFGMFTIEGGIRRSSIDIAMARDLNILFTGQEQKVAGTTELSRSLTQAAFAAWTYFNRAQFRLDAAVGSHASSIAGSVAFEVTP